MIGNASTQEPLFESSDAIEALQELEQNTRRAVIRQRSNERLEIDVRVTVRPGNSSARQQSAWTGVTANVSGSGCMLVTSSPLIPGDIYSVEFQDDSLELPTTLGRCVRSRMIRDDAFEAGVSFFDAMDLADATETDA